MININLADKIAELYIEKTILASDPLFPLWNRENFIFSKPCRWNYIDSCMIKAVTMLYEITDDKHLIDYAVGFTDAYVDEDGSIPTMNPLDFNLDNINGGKNLIYLYKKTGSERYRRAFEKLYSEQLTKQPRLSCGSFFHKAIYPYQIWLDGAYMALPFMAEYAKIHSDSSITEDICRQLENIRNIMHEEKTGLYYHGYDETRSMIWANKNTGLSGEFWLRSLGWLSAGLVDLCDICDNSSDIYKLASHMLSELLESVSHCIAAGNMLYQLPARPEIEGNYPETSGTLLIAYASLKAYRLGICGEKAKTDGIRLLSAVIDKYIKIEKNGLPVLKNICLMAGLGGGISRDGSPEYYLSEPVVENDAKGIAPFLMAYTELKRITAQ